MSFFFNSPYDGNPVYCNSLDVAIEKAKEYLGTDDYEDNVIDSITIYKIYKVHEVTSAT